MIYHLVARSEWSAACNSGSYAPQSLSTDGFIHCSTLAQLESTANQFFRGSRDLVALCIEESRLRVELRFEAPADAADARSAERFPHLYGRLNLDAVVQVIDFPCSSDGSFVLPAALALR